MIIKVYPAPGDGRKRESRMFAIKLFFANLTKKMWPKVTFFALLAVVSILLSLLLRQYIPKSFADTIGADTVEPILGILASSMLAVTTFSLTTMLSAFSSASSSVTPRSTQLLMQDSTTQNVLATFLGSFLFSLLGIIGISAGVYDGSGRFVLFLMSLCVVALILFTLIRWIERLTKLGRLGETTKTVEDAATNAMCQWTDAPSLGASPLTADHRHLLEQAKLPEVRPEDYAYIQFLDVKKLSELARKNNWRIFVRSVPGAFVGPESILAWVDGELEEANADKIRSAFVMADERTFEQDARFGVCVLAEIALRALSPAVNDPGTAIDVIGRLVRLLAVFAKQKAGKPMYPNVWIPPLEVADLFEDAFAPMLECCGNLYDVHMRLLKALRSLHAVDVPAYRREAALYISMLLRKAEQSGMLEEEKQKIRSVAAAFV